MAGNPARRRWLPEAGEGGGEGGGLPFGKGSVGAEDPQPGGGTLLTGAGADGAVSGFLYVVGITG